MQDLHSCSRKALQEVRYPGHGGLAYSIAQSIDQEPEIPHASLFVGLDKEDERSRSSTDTNSHLTSYSSNHGIHENIKSSASILQTKGSNLPTVSQCAVHLELLEVIFALQQRVLASSALDRTFGLKPDQSLINSSTLRRTIRKRDKAAFTERRKVKWDFFVRAAAARFEAWWGEKSFQPDSKLKTGEERRQRTRSITDANLPPLDVLMVWHSFLLNPGLYHAHCAEAGMSWVLNIPFPWTHVHRAINSRDRTFTLHPSAASTFVLNTGYEVDLLMSLSSEDVANSINGSCFQFISGPKSNVALHRLQNALYTDFTIVLTAAIARQADFTCKMALKHLWLRSPSASHTLTQAVERYSKFLALFRLHPHTLLVPSLDIDLAWHTHQLSPAVYRTTTELLCGRFVDHDAGLAKEIITEGWETTARLWDARWHTAYKVCMCWDCEGLAVELEKSGDGHCDIEKLVKKVKSDVAFHRAVEISRRKGDKLPIRVSSR